MDAVKDFWLLAGLLALVPTCRRACAQTLRFVGSLRLTTTTRMMSRETDTERALADQQVEHERQLASLRAQHDINVASLQSQYEKAAALVAIFESGASDRMQQTTAALGYHAPPARWRLYQAANGGWRLANVAEESVAARVSLNVPSDVMTLESSGYWRQVPGGSEREFRATVTSPQLLSTAQVTVTWTDSYGDEHFAPVRALTSDEYAKHGLERTDEEVLAESKLFMRQTPAPTSAQFEALMGATRDAAEAEAATDGRRPRH